MGITTRLHMDVDAPSFFAWSFATRDLGRFQQSYREFLRCDKDSLGFCSTDFYRTMDGYKKQSRHSAAVFLMERTALEARETGPQWMAQRGGLSLY